MKLLIFLLFPLSAMSQYIAYEPIIWVGSERTAPSDTVKPASVWMPNYAPCDDVDTVFGRVIYANEYRVLNEKGYMVTTWGHHEQLVEIKGRSTPQMTWMHWDWVRDKEPKSVTYRTWMGEAIELKNVIKFIPND